jgi:hypothetical protein
MSSGDYRQDATYRLNPRRPELMIVTNVLNIFAEEMILPTEAFLDSLCLGHYDMPATSTRNPIQFRLETSQFGRYSIGMSSVVIPEDDTPLELAGTRIDRLPGHMMDIFTRKLLFHWQDRGFCHPQSALSNRRYNLRAG